jgi:hypothetical protein
MSECWHWFLRAVRGGVEVMGGKSLLVEDKDGDEVEKYQVSIRLL